MKIQRSIILFTLLFLVGCVSISPPSKYRTAEKKLGRHIQGIDLITKLHPKLSKQFVDTVRITLAIADKEEKIVYDTSQDTKKVDSLLSEHKDLVIELELLESLLKKGEIEGSGNKVIAKKRIKDLQQMLLRLKGEVMIVKDTTFIFVDSIKIQTPGGIRVVIDSTKVSLEGGQVILERLRKGDIIVVEKEVIVQTFDVTVTNYPLGLNKRKLIVIGSIVLLLVIGAIVIKIVKPF